MNTVCEITNTRTKDVTRAVLCLDHLRPEDEKVHGPVYQPCDVCRVERVHKIVCLALKGVEPLYRPGLSNTETIANLVGMATTFLKQDPAWSDEDIAEEIVKDHIRLFITLGDRINPSLLAR